MKKPESLEARLREVEDRLAIYTLIASHPPSADTAYAEYTKSVYVAEGVFDRGPTLDGARGADAIAAFTQRPEHETAIRGGLAHFAGLPLIDLRGDEAFVTSYLQIIQLDHEAALRDLPNHGASHGYRIHRVVVNRWHLVKRDEKWWIERRTLLPVDGSDAPRALLKEGLANILAERSEEVAAEKGERLPLLKPADLSDEQAVLYKDLKGRLASWARDAGFQAEGDDGTLLGPLNAYLYNPALGTAIQSTLAAERKTTSLSPKIREVVIIGVGAVWRCAYEVYAHCAVARSLGVADEDVDALAAGRAPRHLGEEGIVAFEVVRAIAGPEHRVPDALFARGVATFGHRGLVDLIHLAGVYMTVSSLLSTFEVPVP